MALNIKNQEAHELASELAELTGKSMTLVVIDALRAQLEQTKRRQHAEQRVKELLAIGARARSHIQEPVKSTDHGDMLYNELGLPK